MHVGRGGGGEDAFLGGFGHFNHEVGELMAGHGEDEEGGWGAGGVAEAVGDVARSVDIATGAYGGLFTVQDEGDLAVEDVEGFVFVVM